MTMYFLFMTKDGRMKGKGTGSGGPFTLEGQRKGKEMTMILKNVENSGRWNIDGKMNDDNHRIDFDEDYWYVLPEGSTGM